MARGTSGRVVIEINPEIKQELYEQLDKENSNLKAWFLAHVDDFLRGKQQLTLGLTHTSSSNISTKAKSHEV